MATSSLTIPIIIEDKKYCTPCKKTGQVAAQYYCTDCEASYCESCFEFHTRIPMLAKHIVLKGKDIDVWADLPYKCHTHGKTYEFFCGKHETLCCHICVSLQHRSCSDMEYIPEKAKNICTKSEFHKTKLNTVEDMKQILKMKNEFEKKTQVNKHSKEKSIKELKEFRKKINGFFDSSEKKTLEIMDKTYSDNNICIIKADKEIREQENDLRLLQQQLDTASPEKEVLVFICLKRGEKMLSRLKEKRSRLDTSTNRDNFQLIIHPEIERFVQNLPNLGLLEDEQTRQDSASEEMIPPQRIEAPPFYSYIPSSQPGFTHQIPPQQNYSHYYRNQPLFMGSQAASQQPQSTQSQVQQQFSKPKEKKQLSSIVDLNSGKDTTAEIPKSHSATEVTGSHDSGSRGTLVSNAEDLSVQSGERNVIATQFAALVAAKMFQAPDPSINMPTHTLPPGHQQQEFKICSKCGRGFYQVGKEGCSNCLRK